MFLPETHPLVAPPPQVDQLEAVVTATAEQLTMVGAEVQWGDFTLSRKLLITAGRPEWQISFVSFIWYTEPDLIHYIDLDHSQCGEEAEEEEEDNRKCFQFHLNPVLYAAVWISVLTAVIVAWV